MLKRRWCTGAVLASLSIATPATAQTDPSTRAAARNIATAGVQALEQGDVELATQKLTKAFELLPVPSIALWLGRALAKKGQLVEAAEHFIQAGRLSVSQGGEQAVQEQAQRDAAKELNDLTPRIPKLVITLEGAKPGEVTLSVDGKALSTALLGEEQPINPGAHAVRGTRGAEVVEQSVTVVEGQKQPLVLRFRTSAVPDRAYWRSRSSRAEAHSKAQSAATHRSKATVRAAPKTVGPEFAFARKPASASVRHRVRNRTRQR